eukprot:gnl/Spiro4/11359_TR5997_c0_g1_i1.p1 gnl/Spiro4/11359_TR5997_c0_g1~~gnl/Spiro4/11359_TR5997_c0_g1_i1.p1  ORF type:complete len:380 (-),score=76.17 gnl/Spiro4/11359_TR5997_c0_g1_i1:144-1163(-)
MGMCNPLLDISSAVPVEMLTKYGLQANNVILAEESHMGLFDEMTQLPTVEYIAGGATQNSIRVAQALLQLPRATSYIGCVGDDQNGQLLEAVATSDQVNVMYQRTDKAGTGKCACLITGAHRCLVCYLGAANCYTHDYTQTPAVQAAIDKARVFYASGFFQTVCPDTIMQVARHALATGKIFCHNLSAPFLTQVPIFRERIDATLPLVDILFGNETEALVFSETHDSGITDIPSIAVRLANLPKEGHTHKRLVVITQGEQPVVVAQQGCQEHVVFPVPPLTQAIVDTNGAGDAFVGGFLSKLILGGRVDECVSAGHYAAAVIISQSGAKFPKDGSFRLP